VNWLDYVFVFLVVVFSFQGLSEGFSRLAVGLVATIAGLLIASWSYGVPAAFIRPYMGVQYQGLANVLGFLFVFIVIQIFGAIIAALLARVFRWTGLGWLDRLLGFAFGAIKAVFVGVILVLILTAFPYNQVPGLESGTKAVPSSIAHSRVAPYLIDAAHMATYLAPRELRSSFSETYDNVREWWRDHVTDKHIEPKQDLKKEKS
jgi:membrane protein required for colicin V production